MSFTSILAALALVILASAASSSAQGLLNVLIDRTCNNVNPSPPHTLILIPKVDEIEASWMPPKNRPCGVYYDVVAIASTGSHRVVLQVAEPTVRLTGLQNGVRYEVIVTARTATGKSTPVVGFATPTKNSWLAAKSQEPGLAVGWTCSPQTGPSTCAAAASGLCKAMTCAEIAKRGLCKESFMRQIDWDKRVVVQYCSNECDCSPTPTLRQTLRGNTADDCCIFETAEYWQDENGRSTTGI